MTSLTRMQLYLFGLVHFFLLLIRGRYDFIARYYDKIFSDVALIFSNILLTIDLDTLWCAKCASVIWKDKC